MTKEEKIKDIEEIDRRYALLVKKVNAMAKLKPCKKPMNALKRARKTVSLAMEAYRLNMQRVVLLSIPTPKHNKVSIASVGESGNEMIIKKHPTLIPLPNKKVPLVETKGRDEITKAKKLTRLN